MKIQIRIGVKVHLPSAFCDLAVVSTAKEDVFSGSTFVDEVINMSGVSAGA